MRATFHPWADDSAEAHNYGGWVAIAKEEGFRQEWILEERVVRVGIAVVATVIGLATIATRSTPAVDWSLMLPTIAAFWLYAAVPSFPKLVLYVVGFSAPMILNLVESDNEVSMFLVVLTAAIAAGFDANKLRAATVVGLALLAMLVFALTGAFDEFSWPNWTFGVLFSCGFGQVVHSYRRTIDELRHARSLVEDQAATRERHRIARDVHDLVGHSLSVVMLHVTGARLLVRKDPAEAEQALEQAEEAGRASLAEIRRTVGILRDEDDTGAALPSPDLDDIVGLVDEFQTAGLEVSLVVDGETSGVEASSALAGYRIVQEALTNASRHNVGARVAVRVDVRDESFELTVRNQGGTASTESRGSGFGLVSMRERARSVGGSLIAGPSPEGWTVEAVLPVTIVEVAR